VVQPGHHGIHEAATTEIAHQQIGLATAAYVHIGPAVIVVVRRRGHTAGAASEHRIHLGGLFESAVAAIEEQPGRIEEAGDQDVAPAILVVVGDRNPTARNVGKKRWSEAGSIGHIGEGLRANRHAPQGGTQGDPTEDGWFRHDRLRSAAVRSSRLPAGTVNAAHPAANRPDCPRA
jgi:hypothetical protein